MTFTPSPQYSGQSTAELLTAEALRECEKVAQAAYKHFTTPFTPEEVNKQLEDWLARRPQGIMTDAGFMEK